MCSLHLSVGSYAPSSLGWCVYIIWNYVLEICVFSPMYSFILYLLIFISLWTHEYLFYTLSYNPMYLTLLLKLFWLWPLGSFTWLLGSFWHVISSVCVYILGTSLLSGHTKWSRLILYVSCPRPRISHLSKKPWFLLLKIGFRNHDLGSRYALFHWDVVSFRSSHWQTKIYMYA